MIWQYKLRTTYTEGWTVYPFRLKDTKSEAKVLYIMVRIRELRS